MREPRPTSAIPTSSFKHLSQPQKKKPQDPELQTCRSTDPLTHDPHTGVEAQPTAQRERVRVESNSERERETKWGKRDSWEEQFREREGDEMRKKRELRRLIEERERIEKIKKQIQ